MKAILHIIFLAIIFPLFANAQIDIPTLDTIVIEKEHYGHEYETSTNEY